MIDPIKLTQDLIKFKSITPIDDGIIDYLIELLTPLGFKCEKLIFEDVTNLYAKLGSSENNFCFAGHTDVVPIGDIKSWLSDPFEGAVINNELIGRGVVDMKGAIAAFISAMCEFIKNNQPSFSISLLITGDEEAEAINGTKKVLEYLHKKGEKLSFCLVGEPTSSEFIGDVIKIGRRGSISFKLEIYGTQGHVAYPHLANNPIDKLITILNILKNYNLDDGNEFFDPSNLEITSIDTGNLATNVIPANISCNFNIRFNDHHTVDSLRELITNKIKLVTDNFKLELNNNPSESFICKNDDVVNLIKKSILEVTDIHSEISTGGGTSDARFIKNYCPVIELGLTNKTAHHINEKIHIDDIKILKNIYYKILENYN